jgi:molecular chaperone GrpE
MDKTKPENQEQIQEEMDISEPQLLAEKDKKLKECEEKVLRLAAEVDNFKKRIEKEKAEHIKFALESFANDLVPFLDNIDRAIATAKDTKDIGKLIEGLELTLTGYIKILERFGLKRFIAEGQTFDPNYHEALSIIEMKDIEENVVVEELLKGYALHEKVLRPALVIVSKKPESETGKD